MGDFKFLQNTLTGKWVISAPRRAFRPDISKDTNQVCPFCPGREDDEKEVYRIGGEKGDSNWQVRVLNNKFPFAPVHEVIIHSQDHHKNFGELEVSSAELVFKAYRQRYQTNSKYGQVYIFSNSGEAGGESLPHPHSQLVVVPNEVNLDILPPEHHLNVIDAIETTHFFIFSPETSQWPDEVWIQSKESNLKFGDIDDNQIKEISSALSRLIQILSLRHGNELPYNFYIYPGVNWYLRITPRLKSLGGFEIGTGIFVNTQDPKETMKFIKEHFENPDENKIKSTQQAYYKKAV